MVVGRKLLSYLLGVSALLAGLAFPVESRAAGKPKPPAAKHGPAKSAVEMRFEEAQALREAFILLAGANHDYNGHRVHAMGAVKAAIKILDDAVEAQGSAKLKAAAAAGRAATARAEKAAHQARIVHEAQRASDLQLLKAGEMLAQVRDVLARNKQKKVLNHVDSAIHQVTMGLKTR
jgi:hypothetical protein